MAVAEEEEKGAGEVKRSRDLLWDCFVNWSLTLERVEEGETDASDG
jgi:hypothetical protein